MIILGIQINIECGEICPLKYMQYPDKSTCFYCFHFKQIDIPRIFEEIRKIKEENDKIGKWNIVKIDIKDNIITNIMKESA